MGDVLTFKPRPKTADVGIPILDPLAGAALRASLEEAAQTALDAADRIIAVLDRMDADADLEDGADAEPSLASPENTAGNQIVYMRGTDQDREADAPEAVLPDVPADAAATPPDPVVIPVPPLRWGGRGNVISAAGTALIDLLERA